MKNSLIYIFAILALYSCSFKEEQVPPCNTTNKTTTPTIQKAPKISEYTQEHYKLFEDIDKLNEYFVTTIPPLQPEMENEFMGRIGNIISADGRGAIIGANTSVHDVNTYGGAIFGSIAGVGLEYLAGSLGWAAATPTGQAAIAGLVLGAAGGAIGAIAWCTTYQGIESSLQAYLDINGGINPNNCNGYSVVKSIGVDEFWKHIIIDNNNCETFHKDTTTYCFDLIGFEHNRAIAEFFNNYQHEDIKKATLQILCNDWGIKDNFQPELQEIISKLEEMSSTSEKEYLIYSEMANIYINLPKKEREKYYIQVSRLMEKYLDSPAHLSAWAIGGSLSVLHYSAKLWKPFTPDSIADTYLVVNTEKKSFIDIITADKMECHIKQHENDIFLIGVPVYNKNKLDRVYFFESTPGQSKGTLSKFIEKEFFVQEEDLKVCETIIRKGKYPLVKNPNGHDVCVLFDIY